MKAGIFVGFIHCYIHNSAQYRAGVQLISVELMSKYIKWG